MESSRLDITFENLKFPGFINIVGVGKDDAVR